MINLSRLWVDESGAVLSSEVVLLSTILVLGMIVGLAAFRDSVVQELGDIAGAIGSLNQSYNFGGITACCASVAGSNFTDLADNCDAPDAAGQGCNNVTPCIAPTDEA